MDFNKDYYAILGVLPTTEKAVIKAAYRALAQIYHPDRHEGSKEDAEFRMRELNEAYSVLSKPEKRAKYDEARGTTTQNADSVFDDDFEPAPESDPLEQKWATAEGYYPDLRDIVAGLNRIAWRLGYAFKVYLLETKEFKYRDVVAEAMEMEFLKTYYGNNSQILSYAKRLLRNGKRDATLELNHAVKILGDDIDADLVIRTIERDFDPFDDLGNEISAWEAKTLRDEKYAKELREAREAEWPIAKVFRVIRKYYKGRVDRKEARE